MSVNNEEMVVTPWEVSGRIDYDKLIREFGTQPLSPEILERIQKHTGTLHPQLQRRVFFSHRDLDWILQKYENGEKFVLYTGRGPSGPVHIGHLVPWIFTKYLQDKFDAKLYFQITDDERFLYHDNFTMAEPQEMGVRERTRPYCTWLWTQEDQNHTGHEKYGRPVRSCPSHRQACHFLHSPSSFRVSRKHEHRSCVLSCRSGSTSVSRILPGWAQCPMPDPRGNRSGSLLENDPRCCTQARILQACSNPLPVRARTGTRWKNVGLHA